MDLTKMNRYDIYDFAQYVRLLENIYNCKKICDSAFNQAVEAGWTTKEEITETLDDCKEKFQVWLNITNGTEKEVACLMLCVINASINVFLDTVQKLAQQTLAKHFPEVE
jgi:hypothetical protein